MGKRPRAATRFGILDAVIAVLLWTTVSCRDADPARVPPAAKRDVILITIDTLRADRVGAPGVTPALDALARDGALFLDATAHAPLTLPSHTSILTGRYPTSHGVHDNSGFALGDSVPTLATILHGAGYHTAAFVASFVLRGPTGLARGFDVYDDRFEGMGRSHQTTTGLQRRAHEVARAAGTWLATAPRPYFLWVHFYDPHAPYDAPPAFAAKFPGKPYDAEVATADFGVSTLLTALPPDRRADTLVVVTGDHGESLGEHGESEHGILLYDATLHVPLIVRGPGIPAGARVQQQVRHVDLLPTIAGLVGVSAPPGIDGVDLLPLRSSSEGHQVPLRSTSAAHPQDVRSTSDAHPSYAESRFGELHFGWTPLHSLRDGTWKYIDGPDPELFQLTADPGERDNRRAARAETATGMARALEQLARRGETATAGAPAANSDVAERLRSLGYVTGRQTLGQAGQAGRAGQAGGADGGDGDPKHEIVRYERYVNTFNDGLVQLESGSVRQAEATFRRLAREFPLAFEPHQYVARALAARRAFDDAVAELDVAIRLSPREAVLYFDQARTLADGAQFDRALSRVAEGRRLEPASYNGALTEGLVARAAGQTDRAERAFQEAIHLNPALALAHLELGRIAEARGDRATARREYQAAADGDAALAAAREALDRISR